MIIQLMVLAVYVGLLFKASAGSPALLAVTLRFCGRAQGSFAGELTEVWNIKNN
jgi:hypothetical protein